jgi:transposase
LRDKAEQWWYFLDHPQVPPDNNRSERSLRLAVTKRKVCGGSRSMEGFAQTATLLTVIQTCRAQRRSAFEFFKLVLTTTDSSNPLDMPSLIPGART